MPTAAWAQEPPSQSYSLQVDVGLVNVDVAVTDAKGNFIDHLARANFALYEDGAQQEITHFAPTRTPVRLMLLVEMSPAVYLIRRDHLLAAYTLLRALRPEDEVALASYADSLRLEVPFTQDKTQIERRLDQLGGFGLGMAEMRLLDAVNGMLEWLEPAPRRTAILLIGTGLDSGGHVSWKELQQQLGASQVNLFAVASGFLLRGEPQTGKKNQPKSGAAREFETVFGEADDRLRALADAGAGEAYFPESAEELVTIYRQIAERLRNTYSLGFSPSDRARDGRYRELEVRLVEADGSPSTANYKVYARRGYFSPRN